MTAEMVFCDARIELVGRQVLLALRQPETFSGYDQVLIPGHGANAAVAMAHVDIGSCQHFKPDTTTMAPTKMHNKIRFTHFSQTEIMLLAGMAY
jgi:hypothetical protein